MMPGIVFEAPFETDAFGAHAARRGILKFSSADLVHALFSTGRAPGDRYKHGFASVFELLHRASLIPAYIRRTPTGQLVRSSLALELDRSEKSGLSYAIGQAFTGIFSEKILSVRFLMHVDRYCNHYGVSFNATRRRPDLMGERHTGWVVAEAKGRSSTMPTDLRQTLIAQKRSVRSIMGRPPEIAFGCVASFPTNRYRRTDHLRVDAFDPVDEEPEAVDLDIDPDRFMLAYYEPYLAALSLGAEEQVEGHFRIARYEQFGIRIGLARTIADRVEAAQERGLTGLYHDVLAALAADERTTSQFLDGTIIKTDWQEPLALPDWEAYAR